MMQFLLKIFRSVLNLLSAVLPDSRGIFVRLESQTVWLKNDDWICTWPRKLHDRPRVHSTSHPADERDTPVQRLDTTHFYCPPVTLKWKSDDLFFAWSRKLHDGARSPRFGAHSVWQPADERVTAVSKTVHITLLLPLTGVLCLESVMSDKVCVCVCVCVRAHTDSFQLKLGSQIDFSVFSAPLFAIFDVSQCTCSQNQCLFPLPLLVPLALLSNIYAATAIISMFSRLAWICVPPFVKYGFSSGASIRSRTLPWILYEQNQSTMKCLRGQIRNNSACCARENAHVRFQLRTALNDHAKRRQQKAATGCVCPAHYFPSCSFVISSHCFLNTFLTANENVSFCPVSPVPANKKLSF